MTAQGHPRAIYQRAIERGNLAVAETTLRELGRPGDGNAHQETAVSTVTGTDVLAAGPTNWRIYYALSAPAPSDLAVSLTFSEPSGAVFETDPGTWHTGVDHLYSDLDWTFPDGSLFFQNPAATGSGQWTATLSLPNRASCIVSFSVT